MVSAYPMVDKSDNMYVKKAMGQLGEMQVQKQKYYRVQNGIV